MTNFNECTNYHEKTSLIHLLDKKVTSQEQLDLIQKGEVEGAWFLFDFSEQLSIDLKFSVVVGQKKECPFVINQFCNPISPPCKDKSVKSLISMRLFPGNLIEIEGANERNESFKESRDFTACFTSDKYAVSESKVDPARSMQYIAMDNFYCIYPINEDSTLQLNLESESPNGLTFKETIYLLTNTKVKKVHKLVMMVEQDLHNPPFFSFEGKQAPARLVQVELKNPTAKISGRVHNLNDRPHFSYAKDGTLILGLTDKAIEFESESEFSNETMQFINRTCNSSGWENGHFRLASDQQRKEMLRKSKDLKSFWNGSTCPVQTGTRLISNSIPIGAELTFAQKSKRSETVQAVNAVPHLLYEKTHLEEFSYRSW